MKTFVLLSFIAILPMMTLAQSGNDSNVLSYYAVGNSLDGQPMIDMPNIMRFFPVYAMQQNVDSVRVTIFYGGMIYSRSADPSEDRKYWEILLPKFKLGDAIQRLEVDVQFRLPETYRVRRMVFDSLLSLGAMKVERRLNSATQTLDRVLLQLSFQADNIQKEMTSRTRKEKFGIELEKSNASFLSLGLQTNQADGIRILYEVNDMGGYEHLLDSLSARRWITTPDSIRLREKVQAITKDIDTSLASFGLKHPVLKQIELPLLTNNDTEYKRNLSQFLQTSGINSSDSVQALDTLIRARSEIIKVYKRHFIDSVKSAIDILVGLRSALVLDYQKTNAVYAATRKGYLDAAARARKDSESLLDSLNQLMLTDKIKKIVFQDSLKRSLMKEIEADLTDTTFIGLSVRRSDVTVDSLFTCGHILYRNYKSSLRYMAALDPAEKMGIFRVRYIPFPIVGTISSPRMNLMKPMSANYPTVFEIGLSFGNAVVPGDDFIVPPFSWQRLGVAFAITERLFEDDADILGLALTYDFNSYGSIGLGGNFAHNEAHGYASFGINKKAFDAAVTGLAKLFGK